MDISNLPKTPGCYIYKNSKGKIIYVGKAKNIFKRVSSYFNKKNHDIKTEQLVKNINSIDFITTDNEIEALLLENNLIKKHRPKYNIDLKDSRRYAYILVTDEKYPRLLTARKKTKKGKYFGPFVHGYERVYLLDLLRKIFKIRTCKRLPKRACLRYHIGLCSAPCIGEISEIEYMNFIKNTELVLKGENNDLIKQLQERMMKYSKKREFEKAITIKNQISALNYLEEKQKVEREKKYNEDIINYIIKDNRVYLILFNVYKGTLTNKVEFSFDYDSEFFNKFIIQYYSEKNIPKEIILPENIEDITHQFLEKQKNQKVNITVPKIGEKKDLLKLVKKNVELSFFGNIEKVNNLKKALDLKFDPNVIECFDISHLSGSLTVGSMVQFRNGLADKNNYRRFKIVSYMGNDDFAGIYEVVKRRYKRLKNEKRVFPDLIIIDGGKGQLSMAIKALNELEVNIPIISIAKQEEEIFVPGRSESILLPQKDKGLLFTRQIRDEAHRFAITYNKLLRKKEIKK